MTYKTIIFTTSGYTEVIRDRERHRITYDTKGIRSRMERRKQPFELPEDLTAHKTPAVGGGYVFKICKATRP